MYVASSILPILSRNTHWDMLYLVVHVHESYMRVAVRILHSCAFICYAFRSETSHNLMNALECRTLTTTATCMHDACSYIAWIMCMLVQYQEYWLEFRSTTYPAAEHGYGRMVLFSLESVHDLWLGGRYLLVMSLCKLKASMIYLN